MMDDQIPTISGIYEFLTGGSEYSEIDKQVALAYEGLVPSISKWLRMVRDYLPAVGQRLDEEGVTHIIDFASGVPTNHLHHTLPDTRIVYSDIDPHVVEEAQALTADNPNVMVVQADVRKPLELLEDAEVQAFLGEVDQLAVGISGISVFIPPDDLSAITSTIYEWVPPGTLLFSQFETKHPEKITPEFAQFLEMATQAGNPYYLYSVEQCKAVVEPWSIETFTPLSHFLGLGDDHITEADREDVELEFFALLARK